jgi:serine/threonine protein kinase
VKAWQGEGAYGAVYRAERVGWRRSQPGALKLSLGQWNWRMEREVELLSRLSHPSIPRLLDRGGRHSPAGDGYPFFVMEWVQGMPLYEWVEQHTPSCPQLCRVLAQLARALEAVHAAGAVHRDIKGGNVLVRLSDRLPVLVDFGSCHFAGAQRLTRNSLPPMTPEYLSPQAVLFYLHGLRHPDDYYPPSPADDLYALGVTAYRMVMGLYPERGDARQDEHGNWLVTSPDIRPLLESNPRVEPPLRDVIVRLLSGAPEARGTAAQVAKSLEAGAGEDERPVRSTPPGRALAWKPWLALTAAGVCAVLPSSSMLVSTPRASDSQAPDAGKAAVGDSSPTQRQASNPLATEKKPVAQESLPEPRPGQARPDAKGRCPSPKQLSINGGCWMHLRSLSAEECAETGCVFHNSKCYGPVLEPPPKLPTSSPSEAR